LEWAAQSRRRRGEAERHKATKRELVVACPRDGTARNHLSHASLGRAVDALEGPCVKGSTVTWGPPSGEREGSKEIQGRWAQAASDFNAEGEKNIVLGCGHRDPLLVLVTRSMVIRMPRELGSTLANAGEGRVIGAAIDYGRLATQIVRVENNVRALVGVDHEATALVARWDVGNFSSSVKHAGNRIMPSACAEALALGGAQNLVVPEEVNSRD
jgi:hypothetical protein